MARVGGVMGYMCKVELVELGVRGLPRYQQELVRNILCGNVIVPARWVSSEDASILAVDGEAHLDRSQQQRCASLIRRSVRLVTAVIVPLIEGYIHEYQSRHGRLSRADLDALRRGRGPSRIRQLLFQEGLAWPEATTEHLQTRANAVLDAAMAERHRPRISPEDRPHELTQMLHRLIPEVHRFALDWTARKRLGPAEAAAVISDVLDQLIRTVDSKQAPPQKVAAWSRVTARHKWRASQAAAGSAGDTVPGLDETIRLGRSRSEDDVADAAVARADLDQQLSAIANELYRLWFWYAHQKPSRPADAVTYLAAARLVDRKDVELLEMIVRRTPDGEQAVRNELARHAVPLSAARTQAVVALVVRILRLRLRDQS